MKIDDTMTQSWANVDYRHKWLSNTAVLSQKTVSAYFTSKHMLLFGFAKQSVHLAYNTFFPGVYPVFITTRVLTAHYNLYGIFIMVGNKLRSV